MSPSAAVAMVVEKATTFAESAAVAGNKVAKGKDLVGVATAALAPNGVRTAAHMTVVLIMPTVVSTVVRHTCRLRSTSKRRFCGPLIGINAAALREA